MPDRSVIVVEDNPAMSKVIQASLSRTGCRVRAAGTCKTGLALILEQTPSLLVLDIGLPDDTGWSLLKRLRETLPDIYLPVIMISAYRVTRGQLREYGVHRFIPKPFDMADLVDAVQEFLCINKDEASAGRDSDGHPAAGTMGGSSRPEAA